MRQLQSAWVGLFITGVSLVLLDTVTHVLIDIRGVPAIGVIGGALILLVFSSMLNWLFKEAWHERNRNDDQEDG